MKYILLPILLLTTTVAMAAPTVSSITGSATHGQVVTVTGASFGTKSTAAPNLWDAVENHYTLPDGTTIPTGGGYPWEAQCVHGGGACVKYESTASEQRGKSTAAYKGTNANYAFMEGRQVTNTGKMYVSWWWKPSIAPAYQSSKFLRLSDSSDIVNKTFSWTMMHNYVYVSGCNPINWASSWAESGGLTNQWNFMEAWVDSSAETYTLRINGNPSSANNYSFSSCGPISFDYVWTIGQDGDSAATTMTSWMDDVYIDNTFARVMIGNASTYSASTHFEMQIPSAWSTSSITATVNQGSFADGATAYLYVVDGVGAVNSNGYPITFGTSQSDTTPPTLSGGTPSGTLSSGTTQVTMGVATNEAATCRWSINPGTAYASMTNAFTTTGGTTHSTTVTGLSNGQSYTRYVRCVDVAGNATTGDYPIAWAVATGAVANGKINASGKFSVH